MNPVSEDQAGAQQRYGLTRRHLRGRVSGLLALIALFFAVVFVWASALALAAAAVGVLASCAVVWARWRKGLGDTGDGGVVVAALMLALVVSAAQMDGLRSPAIPWLVAPAVMAFLLIGRRAGLLTTALSVAVLAGFSVVELGIGIAPSSLPTWAKDTVAVAAPVLLVLFVCSGFWLYEVAREDAEIVLQARNDELAARIHELRSLQTLLPVCMCCSMPLPSEAKTWRELQQYLKNNTEVRLSHGLCHDCASNEDMNSGRRDDIAPRESSDAVEEA